MNRACDAKRLDRFVARRTIYWEKNAKKKNDPKDQRAKLRHHVLRLSGLHVFMRCGVGACSPVCLSTINAAVAATYVSDILILVAKNLCESSQDAMYKSKAWKVLIGTLNCIICLLWWPCLPVHIFNLFPQKYVQNNVLLLYSFFFPLLFFIWTDV